jgi:hypothetical protein
MTDLQKQIYNCYLKYSRNGQPWKPRKDFSDISTENENLLARLSEFFLKFKHIKCDAFFEAPIILHPDEKYPPLKFFISRGAIKTYNLFYKQKENSSPENQLEWIKEGLKFITNFCIENKISFEDYVFCKKGNMPTWTEHYGQHLISPYCLMEFSNLDINKLEEDERELWCPGLAQNFSSFKYRYHNSPKTKQLLKTAIPQLKKIINQSLNFPSR